ncbi:MAG: beta-ketoacyl synthase N-terminal-like domain-containing protein [Candidatus Nezhaarchaeales archaeon]
MKEVAVISVGYTKVSEHWEKSLKGLFVEVALKALENVGLSVGSLDGVYVANVFAGYLQEQTNIANVMADSLGLYDKFTISIDAGGASGALAIHEAFKDIAHGIRDLVLVCGVEKMSDASPQEVVSAMTSVEDLEHLKYTGITIHSLAALIYKTYLRRFNVKQEDVALMSVIDHEHASTCGHAQYPFRLPLEAVMKSPTLAEPIKVLEAISPCDGAAAILMCSHEKAKELGLPHVRIIASEIARDNLNLMEREDLLTMKALTEASQRAYTNAGIRPSDLSFVELYDDYSVMGVIALEKLGLCGPGEGAKILREGEVGLKGSIPVNTFGGLKARGAPLGAVGVYQAVETFLQLTGNAGTNQVKGARVGLTHSSCAFNSIAVINIFEACC